MPTYGNTLISVPDERVKQAEETESFLIKCT